MSSSQPAFQTSVGEDVRFGNHARQTHRILERERMERRAEANSLRTLRGGSKHCKRIRRNRELLEKVMIDDRIHIESAFVCMLDLPHDLPSHVVVRLPRRRLNFAVDPESHCLRYRFLSAECDCGLAALLPMPFETGPISRYFPRK